MILPRSCSLLAGSLSKARWLCAGTILSTGQVLVVGGTDSSGHVIATGELYDPTSGTTSVAGNLNNPRLNHTATPMNNGLVLIAGGSSTSSLDLATAETYQPTVTEPPPFSLRITPATANIPLGGTQKFTAIDNYGSPRLDVKCRLSIIRALLRLRLTKTMRRSSPA